MRAGDLARHGLAALDAAGVEVHVAPHRAATPVRLEVVAPAAADAGEASPPRERSSVDRAAAITEIRRRLAAASRLAWERAEARALLLEVVRAQAAIIEAQRTLDDLDAMERALAGAPPEGAR
ncbi:MAG: hypothetical protein AB7G21_05635 [Dehalococcoidia bacterium]